MGYRNTKATLGPEDIFQSGNIYLALFLVASLGMERAAKVQGYPRSQCYYVTLPILSWDSFKSKSKPVPQNFRKYYFYINYDRRKKRKKNPIFE